MEDRYLVLAFYGNGENRFWESYDYSDVLQLVDNLKEETDIEYIEVLTLSTYSDNNSWIWSNPDSNPES